VEVRIDNVDEDMVAVGVSLSEVGQGTLVSWEQGMMVHVLGASFDVVVVGSGKVGYLVDMLAKMLVVLCLDLTLGL